MDLVELFIDKCNNIAEIAVDINTHITNHIGQVTTFQKNDDKP